MLTSTIVDFYAAKFIEKGYKKTGLLISLCTNLGFLLFFKYLNFTFDNFIGFLDFLGLDSTRWGYIPQIALPIGISFYTFQTLSYTIDVYRGNTKANNNFLEFATYVTMFPQLVAGPIVRYTDIAQELRERHTTLSDISYGIERFIVGLGKKAILANTFAYVADEIFALPDYAMNPGVAWIGIISYSLQIYFDFSGYSDMAIGLGRIMGFRILENFNYPYISKSIKEFWRRWHMSLSFWFRDYVYISLGGNRKGKYRTYINLLIVFFVTGLWHGASWNFVVWGMFHGLFLLIERIGFDKILSRLWQPLQHFYTLMVVIVGWVFFRADTLQDALYYLGDMFFLNSCLTSSVSAFLYLNFEYVLMLVVAIILCTPVYKIVREYIDQIELKQLTPNFPVKGVLFFSLSSLFIVSVLYISASSYNPFIYFRF